MRKYYKPYFAKKQAKQQEKYENSILDLNKALRNKKIIYIKLGNIAEIANLLDKGRKIDLNIAGMDKKNIILR